MTKEEAIARIKNHKIVHKMHELRAIYISEALDMAIKALEQEPKTGYWRAVYQGDEIINYRCSECELGDTNGSTNLYGWNYCRRCGAKMVEPQESEG